MAALFVVGILLLAALVGLAVIVVTGQKVVAKHEKPNEVGPQPRRPSSFSS